MKTTFCSQYFISLIKIIFLSLFPLICFAQNDKETKEALSKIDTSSFKGKGFLNKAQFIKSLIEPLRSKSKDKDKEGISILTLTARHFELLTTIVANADLNDKPKPKKVETIQKYSRDQITKSNIIPIGIINADALLLSETQINDNIKAKEQNKKADSKDYENVEIIAAGLLQGEIFQGNVNFQISLDLIQSNINNKIERIEIDFQDGKGFQKYEFKEQLIPYQFKTIGEIALAIKLITKRGTFLTYNILKIHQLERPSPFSGNNEITAKKVIQESSKNGRITDNVVGGEYAIYTGCDNVFDKPIIIAEGFDMGQNVNIDDMVAKYYPYLYAFRNHGYDLVFVNYSNGQDYIQNNAEVLKRVINEVNSRKIGNNKLVVVGESMSGLVARYALRSMENVEQTHNVSHFIAFDTPHQGANVPPGLVALGRRFYQHTGDFTPLVFLLVPEVRAIFSPAARQLLIHQTSSFGKDPLFDSFRQELNSLGNGGYPNQGGIRNIALLNGALDASPNLNYDFGTLNPGDKILDVDVVGILCNSFIDVWTNLIDADFKVYDADAIGICGISLGYERVNFNRNLDRISGGRIRKGLGYGFPIYSTTNPSFSFVPTFSSIDYRGTLNNDNDYTFPISGTIIDAATSQTTNTTLTPFVAIYGQNFTNTEHSFSNQLAGAWNQLAVRENFGITNAEAVLTNCSLPIPPVVMKTGTFFKIGRVNSTLPSSVCKNAPVYKINLPSTIDLIIPNGNQTSNYQQFIRITGGSLTTPRILNVNGWNIATFNYSNLSNGTYTITTVRRFYGTNSQEVTNSTTMRISGSCRIGANDCPEDNEEGDEIGVLTDVNKSCYASKYNGVWVASLENGEFVSRSRLIANGMNVNSANCFAETDPSGGGYPACNCGFILNSVAQNSGQASGNFVFNSCNATKIKWKIMNGSTELYSEEIEPQSATVPFNVPAIVNSGSYQFVVDGVWCTGTTNSLHGIYEYNITDHLGNLRITFKDSSGIAKITQAQDYDPWGLENWTSKYVNTTKDNRFRMNGKELEKETGLMDLGMRMYNPTIGRLLSIDKAAPLYSSYSTYGYCLNNPIKFVDIEGNFVIDAETARKYPALAYFVNSVLPNLANNPEILEALAYTVGNGSMSNDRKQSTITLIKTYLASGSGPKIKVTHQPTSQVPNGPEVNESDGGHYDGNISSDERNNLYINRISVERLENSANIFLKSKGEKGAGSFAVEMFNVGHTITHEFAHFLLNAILGDNGEDSRGGTYEAGDSFSGRAFKGNTFHPEGATMDKKGTTQFYNSFRNSSLLRGLTAGEGLLNLFIQKNSSTDNSSSEKKEEKSNTTKVGGAHD